MTHAGVPQPQLRAMAQALAGALFALLEGWMYEPEKMSPEAAETLFHRLAWTGVQQLPGLSQSDRG